LDVNERTFEKNRERQQEYFLRAMNHKCNEDIREEMGVTGISTLLKIIKRNS
jgi:hypothetical protein